MMFIKKIFLLFTFCIFHLGAIGQIRERENRNLIAFAKMFGYVQYFHPSDEAAKLDWQAFAVYGTKYVIDARDDDELISRLNNMFKLIGPSIEIYKGKRMHRVNLVPPDKQKYKVVSWQHKGFALPPIKDDSYYKSLRLNRVPPKNIEYIPLTKFIDLSKYVGQTLIYKVVLKKNYMEMIPGTTFKPILYDPSFKTKLDTSSVIRINKKNANVIEMCADIGADKRKIVLGVAFMPNSKIPLQVERVELSIMDVNGKIKTIPFALATDINNYQEQNTTYLGLELDNNGSLDADLLFEDHLDFGSYFEKEIISNINCHIPQALYASEQATYPAVEIKLFNEFKQQIVLSIPKAVKGSDKYIRLADVIILWSILRHSFPI